MRARAFPLALGALAAACARTPAPLASPGSGAAPLRLALDPLPQARWVPEATAGGELVDATPDGTRRILLGRVRVEALPEGALRRAEMLLPSPSAGAGVPSATALPERLGGGYLFASGATAGCGPGGGTQFWRARHFLDTPQPLARLCPSVTQIIAGPDRLLARLGPDTIVGLDPRTGALVAPSPLPVAPRLGALAFADAARGLAFADLVGLVATTDGGASWQPLGLSLAPRNVRVVDGSFVMLVGSERVTIDPRGSIAREDLAPIAKPGDPPEPARDSEAPARHPSPGPLGPRPLRVAIEDGLPLADGTALVARGGRVARVRLDDGSIAEIAPEKLAGEEDARCTTVHLGQSAGLVCGTPGAGTTLYGVSLPLAAHRVAAFARPRAVFPSGNGLLVIAGGCGESDDPSPHASQGRAYCILGAEGRAPREIRTRGDGGVERVVALADGRIAVLIPPRNGDPGQIAVIPAGYAQPALGARPLVISANDHVSHVLRRGLWLEGFAEVAPGELAGWAEAGGALVGVRVRVDDGTVTAGNVRAGGNVVVAGAYALVTDENEKPAESVDGGQTWRSVDAPSFLSGPAKRTCGPVGCVFAFERDTWLRVGWGGAPKNDLAEPSAPSSTRREHVVPSVVRYACNAPHVTPPPASAASAAHAPPPVIPRVTPFGRPPAPGASNVRATPLASADAPAFRQGTWSSFYGVAPPALPAGDVGFDTVFAGTAPQMHLYAWAAKGASGRSARVLGRFFDPFLAGTGVRTTTPSIAPWPDAMQTAEALGFGSSPVMPYGLLDPSGKAAIFGLCRGTRCEMLGLVEGRAVERLADTDDAPYSRHVLGAASAVWSEEAWFLASSDTNQVTVWRIDSTHTRQLLRVPRAGGSDAAPRLVRRARGKGIGLFVTGAGTFGVSERDDYLIPIDPDTGASLPPVRLGPADLGGQAPSACTPDDNGWLVELAPPVPPLLRFEGRGPRISDTLLRARIDTDHVCVEGLSARLIDLPAKATQSSPPTHDPTALTLAARSTTGAAMIAACRSEH